MAETQFDWTSNHVNNWREWFNELTGRPYLRVAELGTFEGNTAKWLMENILTHSTSMLYCVDCFQSNRELKDVDFLSVIDRWWDNLGRFENVKLITLHTWEAWERIGSGFDLIYIDASHVASDVLDDAVNSFRRLKQGGMMLCDDYEWSDALPKTETPKLALDAFMQVYDGQFDLVAKTSQLLLRKR